MLSKLLSRIMYGATLIALLAIDYLLGNGFVEILRKVTCKLMCFIRKSVREEVKHAQILMKQDETVNMSVFVAEILFLALAIALLKKYKKIRRKDKIDDLLQESREMLRQTNEFLDKWRLRRMNTCMHLPDEYTYLDEEPEEIRPCKLEVPILYMAIVDTLGAARSQPESGDAGDLTSRTDAALLSMTSLLDEDLEPPDERVEEDRTAGSRVLWDVQEEGCCNLDE